MTLAGGYVDCVDSTGQLDRLRHHLRRPLARTPYAWDLAMQLRSSKRPTLARRDTAIVIEGFLRSGNTYSVAAFALANGPDLHVARHLHSGAHVLRGVRLGVPTVVLVRAPGDAVRSYLIRRPSLTPHDAALEYLDFYRTAWPARNRVVVAPFEQVVSDFGSVIDAVNDRFGTSFHRYERTEQNERAVFEAVERMNRAECRGEVVESHVGRPSRQREARKAQLDVLLAERTTAAVLEEAEDLFHQYMALHA